MPLQQAMQAEKGLDSLVAQAEATDEQFMEGIALQGSFTDKGMSALVDAIEAALPSMGLSGEDATVGDALAEDGTVTEELTRALGMVVDPINDAIEAGILDADLTIDLEGVDEDRDLTMVASRIRMAYSDKEFKRWLKESTDEEVLEEEVIGEDAATVDLAEGEMSDEEVDGFFMSRL